MVEQSHDHGWWPNLYEPLRQVRQKVADWFAPKADASLAESAYEINIELPGVKPENVEISVHDHSLIVRGEKQSEHRQSVRNFFFCQRNFGSFHRSFRLPPDSDPARIEATFDAGVLTIHIPKSKTLPHTVKKIPIRQAG
ncbi:MAG: Hsp20/alpha crystallin family protein [Hyphomicrobiales bacterium]|nr:Hsp20/alpha crystallin family protein [Hyphomicrobiales bacterium]